MSSGAPAAKSRRSYAHQPHLAKRTMRGRRHWSRTALLHPTSVFCMLVLGVLLAGLSIRSLAEELQVNATVPAPPLQSGAVITSPVANQIFTSKPITVIGSCPDESYVKLFRNGSFSGVAPCQSLSFSIETDLFAGLNTLQAQAYNLTDQAGPVTPTVDVTYTPPAAPVEPAQAQPPASKTAPDASPSPAQSRPDNNTVSDQPPLLLWSDYKFTVITTGSVFRWTLRNQFGTAPYTAHVDWGDGKTSTQSVPGQDDFEIRHRYATSGYFKIVVTSKDAKGQTALLQLAALVKQPGAAGTIGSIVSGAPPVSTQHGQSFRWLWIAWPTYGVISLMAVSFWLGERREYLQLITRSKHRLRHQH
jgi:hypothetical protein